jgi:hypothetical protein
MCSLCGVLGGADHWTDSAAREGVLTRSTDAPSRRRERLRRVVLANKVLKHFGMTLSDWQGSSYLLSTLTGKTEIVENLTHLWIIAERLSARPCDPLSHDLLRRLETADG